MLARLSKPRQCRSRHARLADRRCAAAGRPSEPSLWSMGPPDEVALSADLVQAPHAETPKTQRFIDPSDRRLREPFALRDIAPDPPLSPATVGEITVPPRGPSGMPTRPARKHNSREAGQIRRRAGRVRDRLRKTQRKPRAHVRYRRLHQRVLPVVGEAGAGRFGGRVVGFCNPDCRNRFETAVRHFQQRIDSGPPDEPQEEK